MSPAGRARSTSESLLSIVLLLEFFVVFFIALTLFGLDILHPAIAFGGGAAFMLLLLLVGRLVRYPWGVAIGWALQLALIALGVLQPVLYIVGAIFAAIWVYCFVKGRQLDHRRAEYLAANNTPTT